MSQVRQCGHRVAITLISMLHRQRSAEQYFGMAADEENISGAAERSDAHRRWALANAAVSDKQEGAEIGSARST